MDPNREAENDSFPEFDALQDVLSTAHHNRQVHDWFQDLHSREEGAALEHQDLTSHLNPTFVTDLEPSFWSRITATFKNATATFHGLARLWHSRKADFYLLVSVIILGTVIEHTIGIRSLMQEGSWASQQLHQAALDFGVIDRPRTVEAAQPEARVWVDFSSGVYYCPGSRKYGKTHNGQFTTEGNARLSQYEPASHKACK